MHAHYRPQSLDLTRESCRSNDKMTRIDMAVAIACISILLSSALAAPPIIPKAQDSHVSIREVDPEDVETTDPSPLTLCTNTVTCPGTLSSSSVGSKTFELRCSPNDIDYATAAASCVAEGMILAKIENIDELNAVAALTGLPTRAWIGITDQTSEVNSLPASAPPRAPLPPHVSVSAELRSFVAGSLLVRGWDSVQLLLQSCD